MVKSRTGTGIILTVLTMNPRRDVLSDAAVLPMQVAGELARERLANGRKGDGKTERGLLRFLKKRGIDA